MPVIKITAMPQKDESTIPGVLTGLCLAAARVLGCPPRTVWATWETLKEGHYVEADSAAAVQPRDTHPPLVVVLLKEGRPPDVREHLLSAIAFELCRGLGIEEGNAFITLRELKSGDVYTGGGVSFHR